MTFVLPIPGKWSEKKLGRLNLYRIYGFNRKRTIWVFILLEPPDDMLDIKPGFSDQWEIGAHEHEPPKGE